MLTWSDIDRTVNTSCGHNNGITVWLNNWKSRSAFTTKALFMSGVWNLIGLNGFMTGKPG